MRRVVVTGLGLVTPLGSGVEPTWQRLIAGQSGIKRVEKFDVSDLPCKIAGQVPRGDGSDGTFNPDEWMEPKEQRKVDDFIIFAMGAATQALNDADWHPQRLRRSDHQRRSDRLRHRRRRRHCRDRAGVARPRSAPGFAVFHPGPSDQSRFGLCVDHAFAQRARTTPWSRRARPARTPSAMPAG